MRFRLPSRLLIEVTLLFLPLFGQAFAASHHDWVTPVKPFRIADGLYYVGSRDLAVYLVATPAGEILINANLPGSPPLIRRSVEQLGFRWSDVKILLISHAHVDHAGGAAAIVRETGAALEVMRGDDDVMESGGGTDFAFGHGGKTPQFPPVHVTHVLEDGEKVTLGGVTLVAHRTAGHTRGCTTWTMKVHMPGEPAAARRDVVIGGSWTVLSEYRLLQEHGRPASYPGIAADYAHTFAVLHTLPCDVYLASHGEFFDLLPKIGRMAKEGDRVWIDPEGYQRAVAAAQSAFEADYQRQQSAAAEKAGPHGGT